ncbi:tail fiber domain-containing protein [candidate division WOR-3 bacterium]|nr:tail fiber domain-containing protein [candidate division WOR-3 bacterium]
MFCTRSTSAFGGKYLVAVLGTFICVQSFGAGYGLRLQERRVAKVKSQEKAEIPREVNFQGFLTDAAEDTAISGEYDMEFKIWNTETGGNLLWGETQENVSVDGGIFNVILGEVNAIPDSVFRDFTNLYLELIVGGELLSPRQKLVSVGRSYKATYADTAGYSLAADVQYVDSAGVSVNAWKWNNNAWGAEYPYATVSGIAYYILGANVDGEVAQANKADTATYAISGGSADNDWTISGNVLYPAGNYGLAMRQSNVLYGSNANTHVDFGSSCTTGASGQNLSYCTVSGGWRNTASGLSATVGGGINNTASGAYATISGGDYNKVTIQEATVGGGYSNTASGYAGVVSGGHTNTADSAYATVGGGQSNTTSNNYATVGGGGNNTASHPYATVSGGYINTASGFAATVGGGYVNTVSGSRATISGGDYNTASGNEATVGGGYQNTASSNYTTVGGGYADTASGDYATVSGGENNTASNNWATVGGGYTNTASGDRATVGGGYDNTASGQFATASGGWNNTASNYYATVGGGQSNNASSNHTTVGGGKNNTASSWYATVAGGYNNEAGATNATVAGGESNIASHNHATVGGGKNNTASHLYATVAGGDSNTASETHATVSGGWNNTANRGHATVGGGYENTASNNYATVSGGYSNIASGTHATVGGGAYNTASNWYATVSGGTYNTASGECATVGGGRADTVAGDYSFAAGKDVRVTDAADYTFAFGRDFTTSTPNAVIFHNSVHEIKVGIGMASPGNILTVKQTSTTDPIADGWTVYSSRRWKTNIEPIPGALEKVKQLRGVYFDWKENGKHDMGMIAEEVGEVIPEVVAYEENGEDAKSIDYARLVSVLVEAVKEQQVEIETLKSEIEVLKAR